MQINSIVECYYCGNVIDEKVISSGNLHLHADCKIHFDEEMEASLKAENEIRIADNKNTLRLFKHLKKVLKPKIWQAIEWQKQEGHFDLSIVSIDEVKGSRVTGTKFFGQRTALRHVYDDTTTNFDGDSYGGDVFLYIGKQRYLKMSVWG